MGPMLLDLAMASAVVAFLLVLLKTAPLYRILASVAAGGLSLLCLGHGAPWPRFAVMVIAVSYTGAVINSLVERADGKVEIVKRRRLPRL